MPKTTKTRPTKARMPAITYQVISLRDKIFFFMVERFSLGSRLSSRLEVGGFGGGLIGLHLLDEGFHHVGIDGVDAGFRVAERELNRLEDIALDVREALAGGEVAAARCGS